MEKLIIKGSYWLGALCFLLALLARALNILGPNSLYFAGSGAPVTYHSSVEAAVLFYLTAIATGIYAFYAGRKPEL